MQACRKALPDERFVYVFDSKYAPYGDKSDEYIKNRAVAVTALLFENNCKAVVAGCNTATAVALGTLKNRFSGVITGVFPPVKAAERAAGNGKALVLVTQATSRQKSFLKILSGCDDKKIILAPQKLLAKMVDENFENVDCLRPYVYSVLDKYRGVCSVALGCTHYAFLKGIISDYYAGKVKIFDPSEGVAKRLTRMLTAREMRCGKCKPEVRILFT